MSSPDVSGLRTSVSAPDGSDSIPSHSHMDGSIEQKDMLPPLKSFVPIIKELPGLVLDNKTYRLDWPDLSTDLSYFKCYAQCVEELVLTDTGRDQYPHVAPSAVTWFGMLQDPKAPFLSSLKRLTLVDVDAELKYALFCMSPSLETFTVSNIPQERQEMIPALFRGLESTTPLLSSITLGPGILPASVLQSCIKFVHLRELRLDDAVPSLSFSFLQSLATLPELEALTIDSSAAQYTPHTPSDFKADISTSFPETTTLAPDEESSRIEPKMYSESPSPPATAFPQLRKLTTTSNVLLIHDLITQLFPRAVKDVSLTLVLDTKLVLPSHWNIPELVAKPNQGPDSRIHFESSTRHTFRAKGTLSNKYCDGPDSKSSTNICDSCRAIAEKRREDQIRLKAFGDKTCAIQAEKFLLAIEDIISNAEPFTFRVGVRRSSMCLLQSTLAKMLLCPSLKVLKIENWALPQVEETFLGLGTSLDTALSLKTIQLPLDQSLNTGITLSTLSWIAKLYPCLREFKCFITMAPTDTYRADDLVKNVSASHGLKELGVGGPAPYSLAIKAEIAPYICYQFPNLQRIVAADGIDQEGWECVHVLVRTCQRMRELDRSLAAPGPVGDNSKESLT